MKRGWGSQVKNAFECLCLHGVESRSNSPCKSVVLNKCIQKYYPCSFHPRSPVCIQCVANPCYTFMVLNSYSVTVCMSALLRFSWDLQGFLSPFLEGLPVSFVESFPVTFRILPCFPWKFGSWMNCLLSYPGGKKCHSVHGPTLPDHCLLFSVEGFACLGVIIQLLSSFWLFSMPLSSESQSGNGERLSGLIKRMELSLSWTRCQLLVLPDWKPCD